MVMKVDRVKVLSNRRRYEYWRGQGIAINGGLLILSRKELDDYTDRAIWELDHPGESSVQIVEPRGVPSQGHLETVIAGDTTECRACGQVWDTNDPAPPPCGPILKEMLENSSALTEENDGLPI